MEKSELLSQQLVQNRYIAELVSKKTRDISSSFCRLAILKKNIQHVFLLEERKK